MDIQTVKSMVIDDIREKISSVIGDYNDFIKGYKNRYGDCRIPNNILLPLNMIIVPHSKYATTFGGHKIVFFRQQYENDLKNALADPLMCSNIDRKKYFDVVSSYGYHSDSTLLKDRSVETLSRLSETITTLHEMVHMNSKVLEPLCNSFNGFEYVKSKESKDYYKIIQRPFVDELGKFSMTIAPLDIELLDNDFGKIIDKPSALIKLTEKTVKHFKVVSQKDVNTYIKKCGEVLLKDIEKEIKFYTIRLSELKNHKTNGELILAKLNLVTA